MIIWATLCLNLATQDFRGLPLYLSHHIQWYDFKKTL